MTAVPTKPVPFRAGDALAAFQLSAAVKAALDLDLFTAIGEGHETLAAIAERCRIALRGARILADYLAINSYLIKDQGHYCLSAESAIYLDRRSSQYVGGRAQFLHAPHVYEQFGRLAESVRRGGAAPTGHMLEPDHEIWVRFARSMADHFAPSGRDLAQRLLAAMADPRRPLKILDIAAGHGLYGLAFAQLHPQARVVAQDWAAVLNVAQENARRLEVLDRFQMLPGNAFEVPFDSGFDLVIIANFLHHFAPATNITLLKKAHAALAVGGVAVSVEFAPDDDRLTPAAHGAFALMMLATTPAGDAYTVSEIGSMYQTAGFKDIVAGHLESNALRFVVGRK